MIKASPIFHGGFHLDPATQAEIDYVENNFRDGERHEQEVEMAPPTTLDDFESCWTVRAKNGDIVGYFGILTPPDESFLSRTRCFCFMSCTNANKHKLAFVKATKPVYKWVVGECPKWVDTFLALPLASYEKSVRWQKKVLGMREVSRVPVGKDEWYVVLELKKQEVELWQ